MSFVVMVHVRLCPVKTLTGYKTTEAFKIALLYKNWSYDFNN